MITIDGGTGNGTVWAAFKWGTVDTSHGSGHGNGNDFPLNNYPCAWYLPPPDGVWYPTDSSVYGPRVQRVKAGWINSTTDNIPWNDCQHSSFDGSLAYLGDARENGPYFRTGHRYNDTANPLSLSGWYSHTGVPLNWQVGKAMTVDDPRTYNRFGELVRVALVSSLQDYYYSASSTSSAIVPPHIASTAPAGSLPIVPGEWMVNGYPGGAFPSDLTHRAAHRNYEVDHVSDNVWKFNLWYEYHTHDSYTKAELRSPYEVSTGLGYLLEACHHFGEMTVTHIRSTRAGVFHVRVKRHHSSEWMGWQPWEGFGGESERVSTYETLLTVMSPGLVAEQAFDTSKLDAYANLAASRAQQLYQHKIATTVRSLALSDTTELDSNWIENLSQLGGTTLAVKSLLEGFKAYKCGSLSEARRALSDAYLAYSYAIRPAIADAQDLAKNGKKILDLATTHRFSAERRRGRKVLKDIPVSSYLATLLYTTTFHLKLKDNPFAVVWAALEKIGLNPTAANLWDLVPYSFVADWFIPVGPALTRISDYNSSVITRDLLARIESFKVLWDLPIAEVRALVDPLLEVNGKPVSYKWYDRRIYHSFGSHDPLAGQPLISGPSVSQMVQGGALISSYKR